MGHRLGDLAERLEGRVEGDPSFEVEAVRTLEAAGPLDLAFVAHRRYRRKAAASDAGALLVPAVEAAAPGKSLLIVDEVYFALARLLEIFHPQSPREPGVHPTAIVEPGAEVDAAATIGPYAVVGSGSRVAGRAVLEAHVVVGRDCVVGEGAWLYPHVTLYDRTVIGAGSVLHAGAVVGSDGFGYAQHGGRHHKIPQVGRAVVEDEVELGANTTVDRALLDETRVGAGSKVDNLVQIGHNVRIGRGCLLISQSGIAGSTRLGDGVILAGQAGVGGHLELGDGVRVAAKSAVFKDVEAGRQVAGIPAVDADAWRRQQATLARLDDLRKRLRAIERILEREADRE